MSHNKWHKFDGGINSRFVRAKKNKNQFLPWWSSSVNIKITIIPNHAAIFKNTKNSSQSALVYFTINTAPPQLTTRLVFVDITDWPVSRGKEALELCHYQREREIEPVGV